MVVYGCFDSVDLDGLYYPLYAVLVEATMANGY